MESIEALLRNDSPDLILLQEHLDYELECNKKLANSITECLIDSEFLNEIKIVNELKNVAVYFGKTLRDIKVVIRDDEGLRGHEIFLQYKGPKKLLISSVKLPPSTLLNREYSSLGEVVENFRNYVNYLRHYFQELDYIDRYCTVMEPTNATFQDCYRKILLDNRTWLHVEVTPEGVARNIHLVGHSPHWYNKLQLGLSMWDHDVDIVENIMTIFEISDFPQTTLTLKQDQNHDANMEDVLECAICLCSELPDVPGMPQPLCQNKACGVYYHRNCLYQWLVACAGSRPPALGIANGECPRCHQPITCSEKDN